MNLDKLSMGEKILGVSGLALFVLSFLKLWVKVEADSEFASGTARGNAWDGYGFLLKLGLFLAIAAVALVVARAANVNMSVPWSNAYLALAFTTLALVALTLAIGPEEGASFEGPGVSFEISRGIGLFIGTLLAAAMAVGAWMHYKEAPAAAPGTAPA